MNGEVRGAVIAFTAAAALTALMAAPVLMAPSERVFGSAGTFAQGDPNRDPLVVIEQMRTGRVPAPYLQPLTDLPGRALARVMGPVAAYNALVLITFPLSAAAAYLLARHLLGSPAASLVAALAFAFLPFHAAHAAHHVHVAQTQWIPLYFLALWRCADRPDARRVVLLLAATAAVALSNFYGGFIAIVTGPFALAAYATAMAHDPGERRWRRLATPAGIVAGTAVATLALLHVLVPAALAFPRSDLFLHAARWWSYLVPPVDHPLAGSRVHRLWTGSGVETAVLEQQVGIGWSLLVLALVPVWRRARGDRGPMTRMAPVLAAVAFAAFVCSLAPEWRIGAFTLLRPSALLYAAAPMFRAYARFGVVVGLMVAILAGGGAALLLASRHPWSRRAAVALLVLAALELAPFPPWRFRDVLPTRAHRWAAGRPEGLRILDCVSGARVSDVLAIPLAGQAISLLGTPGFDDCGEPRLADKLRARGFTHVIVRGAGSRLAQEGFAPGPAFADSAVFEVTPAPTPIHVDSLDGFFPRESDGARSWRWMGRRGALIVANPRASADAVLEVELKAFPGPRRLEWLVNGQSMGAIDVGPEWRTFTLPLGRLGSGASTIMLAGMEPASVADDVLHNGDARPLAIALGAWRLVPAAAR